MVLDPKPAMLGHFDLALFDLGIVKLFDVAAFGANDVIVMPALFELEDRFTAFKMMAYQQAGLFELREHAVNGRKAGVCAFPQQGFVYVFSRKVANLAFLEDLQYAQPRQRRFEADGLEVGRRAQCGLPVAAWKL